MIITLGRQHGSNGHDIARALAKELDYRCFDKEIVEEAAENSHFSKEIFDSYDEKRVNAYIVPVPHYVGMNEGFRLNMQVATAQFDVMRSLAEKGNLHLRGPLRGLYPGATATMLCACSSWATCRPHQDHHGAQNLSEDQAKKLIKEVDKDRSSYYRYYTDQIWGEAENYDLCIDSGRIGVQGVVDVIKAYIAARK